MDGAATGGVAVAQAVASAAALFDAASEEVARRYGGTAALGGVLIPAILGVPGGLPVHHEGRLVAGLGVGGTDPALCARIATAALTGQPATVGPGAS
jgi:uncharacterized protein GlcG (DUF336 family)